MAEKEERQLARWEPFGELAMFRDFPGIRSRFGRLFDEALGGESVAKLATAVDITESDDEYLINAEVPGVKKGDLTVEIQEGVLTLRGEKKSEREEKKEKARLIERSYGTFTRSFSLPADADAEKIDAKFADGVLKVKIAKRPEDKPKQVAIKA